jgi:hypothetical protein
VEGSSSPNRRTAPVLSRACAAASGGPRRRGRRVRHLLTLGAAQAAHHLRSGSAEQVDVPPTRAVVAVEPVLNPICHPTRSRTREGPRPSPATPRPDAVDPGVIDPGGCRGTVVKPGGPRCDISRRRRVSRLATDPVDQGSAAPLRASTTTPPDEVASYDAAGKAHRRNAFRPNRPSRRSGGGGAPCNASRPPRRAAEIIWTVTSLAGDPAIARRITPPLTTVTARTADSAYSRWWIGSSVFLGGRRPPGALPQTLVARRGTAAVEVRATAEQPRPARRHQ